jgi:hypothetical protein
MPQYLGFAQHAKEHGFGISDRKKHATFIGRWAGSFLLISIVLGGMAAMSAKNFNELDSAEFNVGGAVAHFIPARILFSLATKEKGGAVANCKLHAWEHVEKCRHHPAPRDACISQEKNR